KLRRDVASNMDVFVVELGSALAMGFVSLMAGVRARGKLIPFLWPAFMLARFHGKENCASKEKTWSAANRQGRAGSRPYAARAACGTRRMGGQTKGSALAPRGHAPPGRDRAQGEEVTH